MLTYDLFFNGSCLQCPNGYTFDVSIKDCVQDAVSNNTGNSTDNSTNPNPNPNNTTIDTNSTTNNTNTDNSTIIDPDNEDTDDDLTD